MPQDYNLFVEPFVGSGGVFFNAPIGDRKSVLNDSDKDVMDAYRILKNGFQMKQYNIPQQVEPQQSHAHAIHTNPIDKLFTLTIIF